jgi:(2Fe-2S) ferredoxin
MPAMTAMPAVSHHLLLCATSGKGLCCDPETGAASWAVLKRLVKELGLEDPGRPAGVVLRSKVDCLRVCAGGPILLVWPDGVWYGGATAERLERILPEHLLAGRPVEEWILRRTPLRAPGGTGPQQRPASQSASS